MGRQGAAFVIGPAFLRILRLKSASQYVFRVRVAAAGQPLVDKGLKIVFPVCAFLRRIDQDPHQDGHPIACGVRLGDVTVRSSPI
jgi:hypothetical protein